jgi:HSP20 family protein
MVYSLKIDVAKQLTKKLKQINMTLVKLKAHPTNHSFNNLMENFFTPFTSLYRDDVATLNNRFSIPANTKEVENGYQVEIIAPGLDKENFKIDLDKNTLIISAEVKKVEEEKKEKFIHREYNVQPFKRSFHLDNNIDVENISAQYVNGILTLNLPKKSEVKPQIKQISVQ